MSEMSETVTETELGAIAPDECKSQEQDAAFEVDTTRQGTQYDEKELQVSLAHQCENEILHKTLQDFAQRGLFTKRDGPDGKSLPPPPEVFAALERLLSDRDFLSHLSEFRVGRKPVTTGSEVEGEEETLLLDSRVPGQVGVVDVEKIDWWTLVPRDFDANDETVPVEDLSSLAAAEFRAERIEDSWVTVQSDDVKACVAEFVAACVFSHPAAAKLDDQQLADMLGNCMHEMRDRSAVEALYEWGKFGYTVYGWAAAGWKLYFDYPWLVRLSIRALTTLATVVIL
ncbi:MAG: hypothetical protein MHM6MM_006225 [Cercozoa sp. M6MM]